MCTVDHLLNELTDESEVLKCIQVEVECEAAGNQGPEFKGEMG